MSGGVPPPPPKKKNKIMDIEYSGYIDIWENLSSIQLANRDLFICQKKGIGWGKGGGLGVTLIQPAAGNTL